MKNTNEIVQNQFQAVAWWVGQGWGGKIRILVKGAPLKAYSGAAF